MKNVFMDYIYSDLRTITIKNIDKTTKIVIIVHLLVVFFLIGRFKRVTLTPSLARDVSDAFIIVIMTAIYCCFNKYDHLLHVYQIKRARIQRALRMCDNF